jgi:hypothetical protein
MEQDGAAVGHVPVVRDAVLVEQLARLLFQRDGLATHFAEVALLHQPFPHQIALVSLPFRILISCNPVISNEASIPSLTIFLLTDDFVLPFDATEQQTFEELLLFWA